MRGRTIGFPPVGRLVGTAVVLAGVIVGPAGCSGGRDTGTSAQAGQPRAAAANPAIEAGGACQLLDFEMIRQNVGFTFTVSAAAQKGETYTCIVQARGVSYPDLSLSVSISGTDEKAFQTVVAPAGSAKVTGLGKVAYSAPIAASGDAGPGVEVGWLAANRRVLVLRLRLAASATAEQAADAGPRLIELAKVVDFTSA